MKLRLYNLDYLRGIAAFGIMLFHYSTWEGIAHGTDTFLSRFGYYGVSIFYILSGLTLYYVYYDRMSESKTDIRVFFLRRILRIYPLLWLVTIITFLFSRNTVSLEDLFLNLTGLFGFVKWDSYIAGGAWSIGNELVFYSLFPLFVILTKKSTPLLFLLSVIVFILYVYFSYKKIPADTIAVYKHNYTNPLSQLFLFLSGFLIGFWLRDRIINNGTLFLLFVVGLSVFVFYPVAGTRMELVTGINRMVFTLCCIVVTISFFKTTIRLPEMVHRPLVLLGEASYSVYLLHPIVYRVVRAGLGKLEVVTPLPDYIRPVIAVLATLIVSYFVFTYIEKFFFRLYRGSENRAPLQPA